MQYLITPSEESGRLLRQLCDSGRNRYNDAMSREDFLSAFVEEQLGELFVRRERPKAGKTKKASNAVRSGKDHAKTWRQAVIATNIALQAMHKLVTEVTSNSKNGAGDTNASIVSELHCNPH